MKTKFKSVVALLMCLVFVASLAFPFAYAKNYGEYTKDDPEIVQRKEQIAALDKEIQESKEKQASLQKEIDAASEKASALQKQIDSVQSEIDAYNKKINLLNSQIGALNNQISAIETSVKETENKMEVQKSAIAETQKLLGQRLRAMYMTGNVSTVEIILDADSFESLLTRLELVAQIAAHDNKIVEQLQAEIKELNEMKKQLEEKKVQLEENKEDIKKARTEVEEDKSVVVSKKVDLDAKKSKLTSYLSGLSKDNRELKSYEASLKAKQDAYEAQIDAMINGIASHGSGSVGSMVWPVSPTSGCWVSSGYGYRTMSGESQSNHKGVDICRSGASSGGTNIVASASGTVIYVSNECGHNYPKSYRYQDPHYSTYGNCVFIDHGNGVVTRYGHMSSVSVYKGQHVSAGQKIGVMGCTGYSTGFHLHFEVRVNGNPANPMNYIKLG